MISKPILKQTIKANWKLWLIFTAVTCVLSCVIIAVFDQKMISSMTSMMKDSPLGEMFGDQMSGFTSVLGVLSQSFYSIQGILLPLVFIMMTANSLVAAQVDRGSMAYLLSTPVKRNKVVRTQALYLIVSVFIMFVLLTATGLAAAQLAHGGVFDTAYTEDVKQTAALLGKSESEVADNLNVILTDPEAMQEGAIARGIDEDVYAAYLPLKMSENAYQAAADVLEADLDEVSADPSMIKNNDAALAAAAKVMGMDAASYEAMLDAILAQKEAMADQATDMQNKIMEGLSAAGDVLGIPVTDLASDMGKLKTNTAALDAAVSASEIPEEQFIIIINQQLANDQLTLDKGIDFNVRDYVMLNLGAFLLMFALSGIAFMFSCIFNLSKNSLIFGSGIPIAFFIFAIMAQTGDSLKDFQYLSLNTLFDTTAITTGGSYWLQFVILGMIGAVLYVVGVNWFRKKDLPL